MAAVIHSDLLESLKKEFLGQTPTSTPIEVDNEQLWRVISGNEKLKQLHIAVERSGALCVVIQGPSGCGKTSLLKEYASLCGKRVGSDLVVFHLGEQVDSKVLLGTFTCTTVPGEFVWTPGLLTRCVLNGHWIVMEDIDFAPPDVISMLLPLVKTGKLSLPGYYEPVVASKECRIFLTQRTNASGCLETGHSIAGLLKVLVDHSITVTLPPLTSDEIEKLICVRHPELGSFSRQLAGVILEKGVLLRHVLKFCSRVASQVLHGQFTSIPDVVLDVVDCFCGHLSSESKVGKAVQLSQICGGVSHDMVEQLCCNHKPSVQISHTNFSVGRAYIHCSCSLDLRMCYSQMQSSLSLLEAVSRCVQMAEPVLLVGETGVGKTATINYLAHITGHKLVVMNLSQQTDSVDLLGGYKPVQMVYIVTPLKKEFEELFHATFSLKQNAHFLASVQSCFIKHQWKRLLKLMVHSLESAKKRTKNLNRNLYVKWEKLGVKLKRLRQQVLKSLTFAFSFEKGAFLQAVSEGWWILLDEVNLASAETLQCLSAVLETNNDSLLLMEKPNSEAVMQHSDFRLFCCMNPSTDVGKKSLPEIIRNRFTELYVDEPSSISDLSLMVLDYLKNESPSTAVVEGIVRLYRSLKELSRTKLVDSTGRSPHYSLRNLCRALQYAASCFCDTLLRSLYEGFCMSFLTELCRSHHQIVVAEIVKCLSLSDTLLSSPIPAPTGGRKELVQVSGYWLPTGGEDLFVDGKYILTASVKKNLHNLSRAVSARKYPVLLQGPTSAGKTSLVQYLAKATGHQCLRINNHEHTDLQEYIGMYGADEKGELVFQEGVLVEAMRKGYWIILDELNLAPTEVLEALNRVLDDNRELFIPETRELVKAHPHFILFGTQNPPGVYGGRKVLSRAFRNRFIELHYEDIPTAELVTILQEKCGIPLSYSKKMVAVMKELQVRRTYSEVFSGKYGLITLRDLFRWAERYRRSPTTHQFRDWEQQLAEDGFMLLAGRLRDTEDEQVVLDVIQRHFKRKVVPSQLFGQDGSQGSVASQECLELLRSPLPEKFHHLVWTSALLRMAVLAFRALSFDEPVLLVGDTGCGKTTLCQLFADLMDRKIFSINCHMHSEASDFLGGLKPTRSRGTSQSGQEKVGLFEWQDGVVVRAMQDGCCLLIDEISLADDAVLERLNSVLETERCLLVSERGRTCDQGKVYQVTAEPGFAFMATMNPGGDYGKKELSPALRNRFVEVWCTGPTTDDDFARIIDHNLKESLSSDVMWSNMMLNAVHWIKNQLSPESFSVTVRDLLTWVDFMNNSTPSLMPADAFYHGAHLVLLDGIECSAQMISTRRESFVLEVEMFLQRLCVEAGFGRTHQNTPAPIVDDGDVFGIPPFFVKKGPNKNGRLQCYSLEAPGPNENACRLLRALQVGKPLLIEGPPGVGKTSLVTALSSASGNNLTRINLSEHTDISDLFGCDLPVEGGRGVRFQWRDGPFLRALKKGDWILLDEINLASQSVLEGLNAVLDHRGEVYIPELGITFFVQPNTRLFACQNPMSQGGGRKGLPKSFLNRFTVVFVNVLTEVDFRFIAHSIYPDIDIGALKNMVTFNSKVESLVRKESGTNLWEFNLRDILRWCEIMKDLKVSDPGQFVEVIYCQRLRSSLLRAQVTEVYSKVFCAQSPLPTILGGIFVITEEFLQIGHTILPRKPCGGERKDEVACMQVLHCQLPILEAIMMSIERKWMTILVGGTASGKASTVWSLARLLGQKFVEFSMNSDTDTTELLGGFQQVSFERHIYNIANVVEDVFYELLAHLNHQKYNTKFTVQMEAMLNTDLPDIPRVLQEYSEGELVALCVKLKEILTTIESVASDLNISLSVDILAVSAQIVNLMESVQHMGSNGRFEWVDSVLVTALHYGHWLCITNCNVCNPSVLDRLNALVEPDGVLAVDERGAVGDEGVMTIVPHPNFRLFLLMNPIHGEISRAMRNRGIEICILPEDVLGVSVAYNSPENTPAVPPLVKAISQHPDLYAVLSHFTNVMNVVTSHEGSGPGGKYALRDVRGTLQIFADSATLSDYHIRVNLMRDLATLHATECPAISGAVRMCSASLEYYTNHKTLATVRRNDHSWVVPQLVSGTNPIVAAQTTHDTELQWKKLLLAARIKGLEEFVRWSCECGNSALSLSHQAHTGQVQLEILLHPSLQHVQPLFSAVLFHLSEKLEHFSTSVELDNFKKVIEWLFVIADCFSHRLKSVTELAGLWSVLCSHCIKPLSITNDSALLSLVTSLQPLESVAHCCTFFTEVRSSMDETGYQGVPINPLFYNFLSQNAHTTSCFKELASPASLSDYNIGDYQSKVERLKNLLLALWHNGCLVSNIPAVDIKNKLEVCAAHVGDLVIALSKALEQTTHADSYSSQDDMSERLCSEAEKLGYRSPKFWQDVSREIKLACSELATVRESLECNDTQCNRDQQKELQLLCGVSQGCIHVGLVASQLLLPTAVDPVTLKEIQYNCYQSLGAQHNALVEACSRHYFTTTGRTLTELMSAESPLGMTLPGTRGGISPYVESLVEGKRACDMLLQDIQPPVASFSKRTKYSDAVSICNDVVHTLCSTERVATLQRDANDATPAALRRVETWSKAVRAAVDRLQSEEFSPLADVVKPFTTGLLQTVAGVTALISLQSFLLSPHFKLLPLIRDVGQFPFFSSENGCGSAAFMVTVLESIRLITDDCPFLEECQRQTFHKQLLVLGVRLSSKFLTGLQASNTPPSAKWCSLCSSLLMSCWSLWKRADTMTRIEMEERNSLYKYRTTIHEIDIADDVVVDDKLVGEIFPVYDNLFDNLNGEGEEEEPKEMADPSDNQTYCQFTCLEMREIFKLHQQLCGGQDHHQTSDVDDYRYSFAASLAQSFDHLPGLCTDYSLFGAHARMCKSILNNLKQESPDEERNVYKQAFVREAQRVGPVLTSLKERVEELLMEWPDHPSLVQVKKSCEKVLSLSVWEPLMKILAGVEYILRKSQDWEEYAASHVSLGPQLESITQLILDWRARELRSWSSLLEQCSADAELEGSKWWFHVYSLCQESISESHAKSGEFLNSVHQFIEVSPQGEFLIRLKLLQAFGADMCCQGHSTLGNILLNTFHYYQQLVPSVSSHLKTLTSAIDKEFKDHIRIMRWNDGNYWALKSSTEKSHRTLFKYIKKFKAVLVEPVRPLLTAEALQGSGGDYLSDDDHIQTTTEIARSQAECMDIRLTAAQEALLSTIVIEFVEPKTSSNFQLAGAVAWHQMQKMVGVVSSSSVYSQWNTTVDGFCGEVISTVKQLQSLDYLEKLIGEKRKSAIKLNTTQKRKAIMELFQYLKKQGLSYRNELDFSMDAKCGMFELPVFDDQAAKLIPPKLSSDIQKYFYRCLGRLASLQSAFVNPTKDIPPLQLKRCKGYAGHLVRLVCEERKVVSLSLLSLARLEHILKSIQSFICGEVCILEVAEYTHWQGKVLGMIEMCLELVSEFEQVITTLPEEVDSTLSDLPPILACGDRSIANTALAIFQALAPDLRAIYDQLFQSEREIFIITRNDVSELERTLAKVEVFSGKIGKVVELILGSKVRRVPIFEFLEAAKSYICSGCQQCREWIDTVASNSTLSTSDGEDKHSDIGRDASGNSLGLLQKLVLMVQKVIVRHNKAAAYTTESSGELLEFPCCLYLHSVLTDAINDMQVDKVIDDVSVLVSANVALFSEGGVDQLVPVLPLLHQYTELLRVLTHNLTQGHRTLCKLTFILLSLFSNLVSKGLCVPPEVEQVEGESGIDFETAEGGGFDEGVGTRNVSSEVDPETLKDPTEKSGESQETFDEKDTEAEKKSDEDDAVDMSQDFGGDITDMPDDGEEDKEDGEEEAEYDKEMGQLGEDDPEHIDRNMWVPEEEQDDNEPQESDSTGGGSKEVDEAKIVAQEGTIKPNPFEKGHEPKPGGEEDSDIEGDIKEQPTPNDQETFHQDNSRQEQAMSEAEADNPEFDMENLNLDEAEEEESSDLGGDMESTEGVEEAESKGEEEDDEDGPTQETEACTTEDEQKDQSVDGEMYGAQSLDYSSHGGTQSLPSDDHLKPNSSSQEEQLDAETKNSKNEFSAEKAETNTTSATDVTATGRAQQEQQNYHKRLHRRLQEDYTLAGPEERASKRPRLTHDGSQEQPMDHNTNSELEQQMVQHMTEEGDMEHDGVVWDAAPLKQRAGTHPPSDRPTDDVVDSSINYEEKEQRKMVGTMESNSSSVPVPESQAQEPMDTDTETDVEQQDEQVGASKSTNPETHSYFVCSNLSHGQPALDEAKLRADLKEDIKVLRANSKDVNTEVMWQRYEALMSGLAQSLCEELRLALQPTQASQLKGDYRTGKRLNMRRVIPYIASHFQNDHIWLRRTKPSKREYQVLVAVDDSASMNENECSQMAYESLAMISTALNRLDCGKIGILRFGEHAEVLHTFEEPFTVSTGGHVLQHLSFSQTKTNFVEMLHVSNSLFAQSLHGRRGQSAPLTSQLLLILSDGRGVFADGTSVVEAAIRRLNELGVLTVFVILDSLSKDSVLSIKVPTFIPGKVPVVRAYLETFPFSFYIVLQEMKSLPLVLGKALQQWFQLHSGQ